MLLQKYHVLCSWYHTVSSAYKLRRKLVTPLTPLPLGPPRGWAFGDRRPGSVHWKNSPGPRILLVYPVEGPLEAAKLAEKSEWFLRKWLGDAGSRTERHSHSYSGFPPLLLLFMLKHFLSPMPLPHSSNLENSYSSLDGETWEFKFSGVRET